MSFKVNVEIKKLHLALGDIVDNFELYMKNKKYYNSIQNVFGVIESSFLEDYTYNYYNNDRVKQIVYEHIEKLYDIIDNIYDDNKISTQLKENTMTFKDLLEDFEKNIKITKESAHVQIPKKRHHLFQKLKSHVHARKLLRNMEP